MSEAAVLPWLVIRQDEDGGRYRVGRYATRPEAQELAERLGRRHRAESAEGARHYVVERLEHPSGAEG